MVASRGGSTSITVHEPRRRNDSPRAADCRHINQYRNRHTDANLSRYGFQLHSVSYGAPKASPVPFGGHGGLGAHGHSLDLHAPVAHYEGHHLGHYGVGIGGMQYGVDYKKAKAAA